MARVREDEKTSPDSSTNCSSQSPAVKVPLLPAIRRVCMCVSARGRSRNGHANQKACYTIIFLYPLQLLFVFSWFYMNISRHLSRSPLFLRQEDCPKKTKGSRSILPQNAIVFIFPRRQAHSSIPANLDVPVRQCGATGCRFGKLQQEPATKTWSYLKA